MGEIERTRSEPRHPIRVVARRTGLNLHVLRAWERRYGVVEPVRTGGGQRLYSDADIERLNLLRSVVESGRTISQVAGLDDGALAALLAEDASVRVPRLEEEGPADESERLLSGCLDAAETLDEGTLHRLLLRAMVSLRPLDFIEGVVAPLLFQIGERWHAGELRPSHEHAASIAVRRVLTLMLSAYEPKPHAPTLVTTTVAGDPHEFGSMLASVLAAEAGWRVLYLGASLPAEDIARAARVSGAAAVAVSAVDDRGAAAVVNELSRLRLLLPSGTRLIAGGRVAQLYAEELEVTDGIEIAELSELRELLRGSGVKA